MATNIRTRQTRKRAKQAFESATWHAEALRLRVDGLSVREIAARLGKSVGGVHHAIERELAAIPAEGVKRLRTVEGARLEADYERLGRVRDALMPKALVGNNSAAEVVTKLTHERTNISEKRARLFGLNAKEQVDVSGALAVDLSVSYDNVLSRIARLASSGREGAADPKPDPGGGGES